MNDAMKKKPELAVRHSHRRSAPKPIAPGAARFTVRSLRQFAIAGATIVALILTACKGKQAAHVPRGATVSRPSKPNFIMIVVDTLRYEDSGLQSTAADPSSYFGRLAARGIVFDKNYSTNDETVDSHFALLTGFLHGWNTTLDQPQNLIAAQLQRRGYSSIGVAANGNLDTKVLRLMRGFPDYVCMWDRFYGVTESERAKWYPELDKRIDAYGGRHDLWSRFMVYSKARRVFDEARTRIIAAHQPYFAFINIVEPHDPYFPDPALYSRGRDEPTVLPKGFDPDLRYRKVPSLSAASRKAGTTVARLKAADGRLWSLSDDLTAAEIDIYHRRYRGEIREAQREIERFLDSLGERRLLDSTIVIITADHGESFGEKGFMSHALHNRGDREANQRVPLLILFPRGYGYPPIRLEVLTTGADVAPTIYDYAGVDWLPLARSADVGNYGKSLMPYIERDASIAHQESATPGTAVITDEEQRRTADEARKRLRSLGYIH